STKQEAIMVKAHQKKARRRHDPYKGLIINVGWQGDGGVYQLDLDSEERIRGTFPEANIIKDMLVGYDEKGDFERFHRPHWQQFALMLTGLMPEQIGQLGGIRIYDPVAEKVLWEWDPAKPNSR